MSYKFVSIEQRLYKDIIKRREKECNVMENNEQEDSQWINQPEDILGIGLRNLLSYCSDDPKFHKAVESLNQKIIFDFEDLYAVSVYFHKPMIEIVPNPEEKKILCLRLSLNTLINSMKGKYSIVGAVLRGKIKISRWWNVLALIKLLKILLPALKKATERTIEYGK
jgi:putative sterol carrier protein